MPDSFIPRKNPSATDQKIDTEEVTHGGNDVQRERVLMVSGDSADPIAAGVDGTDGGTDNALRVTLAAKATNLVAATVSVAVTSTPIVASRATRRALTIKNNGSATIWITGETATNVKFPLDAGESYTFEHYTGAVNGIVDSGTVEARYLETYA